MAFCVNCGAQVSGAFCTKCGSRAGTGGSPASGGPPASGIPAAPQRGSAQVAPAASGAASSPRRISPVVWILVAVAALFVLGGIAVVGGGLFLIHKVKEAGVDSNLMRTRPGLALARLLAATNADIEIVSVDDAKGTITLRQKSTGKSTTIDFDQARNGKFTFREDGKSTVTVEANSDGPEGRFQVKSGGDSVTIGANQGILPAWIPGYPDSKPQSNFSSTGKQGSAAVFTFDTKDSPKDVIAFYEHGLKQRGFRITATSRSDSGGSSSGMVSAEDDANRRTVLVTAGNGSSGTTVSLSYQQK